MRILGKGAQPAGEQDIELDGRLPLFVSELSAVSSIAVPAVYRG